MPSPYISKLAKETGKSEKEIERLWKKAKEITSEEFGKEEADFGNKEYKYTTGVVKKMLGVDESILDPAHFLESEFSAKEYLETVVSGNFSIGNVSPPEEEKEEEEDDEEDEEFNEASIAAFRQANPAIPDEEENPEDDLTASNIDSEIEKRFSNEELLDIEKESLNYDDEQDEEVSEEDLDM